jgi:hypothetical protein
VKVSFIILLSFLFCSLYGQESYITDKNGCMVHNPHSKFGESITWSGECVDSLAEGYGELVWYRFGIKTKTKYQGFMKKGKPEGKGLYISSSKWVATGEFKDGNLAEGIEVFDLLWVHDNCIGKFVDEDLVEGTYITKRRNHVFSYEGKFCDNLLEGKGIEVMKGVYKLVGEFKNGLANGYCKQYIENGDYFEGIFENGYYKQGTLILADSTIIKGNFEEFLPIYGTIIYPDSSKYTGGIKNYDSHGIGTYYYTDGDVFKCTWRKGYAHGNGEYKFADGEVHIGKWKRGILKGKGQILYQDGELINCIWKNDEFLKEINSNQ